MTNEEMELLASLKDHPGWGVLMRVMKEGEENILAALVQKGDEKHLVAIARHYQAWRAFRELMEFTPQDAVAEIQRQQQEGMLGDFDYSMAPMMAWAQRHGKKDVQ